MFSKSNLMTVALVLGVLAVVYRVPQGRALLGA